MLTEAQIRKAKPAEKPFKLTGGGRLHLYVSPAGGKLWRVRYEIEGREKLLSLGAYPDLSLSDARQARDKAKKTLRASQDPGIVRKQQRVVVEDSANTFGRIAREWYEMHKSIRSETHAYDVMRSLERDVLPTTPWSELDDVDRLGAGASLAWMAAKPAGKSF